MAKDVATFLHWAAEPEHDERKKSGIKAVILFSTLLVISVYIKRFKFGTIKNRKICKWTRSYQLYGCSWLSLQSTTRLQARAPTRDWYSVDLLISGFNIIFLHHNFMRSLDLFISEHQIKMAASGSLLLQPPSSISLRRRSTTNVERIVATTTQVRRRRRDLRLRALMLHAAPAENG